MAAPVELVARDRFGAIEDAQLAVVTDEGHRLARVDRVPVGVEPDHRSRCEISGAGSIGRGLSGSGGRFHASCCN